MSRFTSAVPIGLILAFVIGMLPRAVQADEPAPKSGQKSTSPYTEPAPSAGALPDDTERAHFCAICDAKKRFHEVIPWLEIGFDLRHRMIYDNNLSLNKNQAGHERFWIRDRARLWARISPLEDIEVNVRLVAEPRYYVKPESVDPHFIRHEALFDILNVKLSNLFGSPLTLTLGRQEIVMGDGWLVLEGTPLDGSRTIHFDTAARATLELAELKTVIDAAFILNHANSSWWIRPFNDRDVDLVEHDEIGGILYVSNKSIPNHTVDGFFIYKHDDRVMSSGFNSELYTFGLRVEGKPTDKLTWRAQVAPQFGRKNGRNVNALGGIAQVRYDLKDKWNTSLRAGYEFRSGSGHVDGGFDPLWGRYPQWSNIYNGYTDALEGRPAMSNNLHRITLGWTFDPCKNLSIATDYHLLFANQNTFAGTSGFTPDGKFRGQLLTCLMKYKFNEHVSTHLIGEVYIPGDYYSDLRNDVAVFARWELMFQW